MTALHAQPADESASIAADSDSAAPAEEARPRRPALPSKRSREVNASEAKRRLAQAEHHRSMGIEPQPGEFTRGPQGISVNYRYWKRQEKLRVEVEHAQRRANLTEKRLHRGRYSELRRQLLRMHSVR